MARQPQLGTEDQEEDISQDTAQEIVVWRLYERVRGLHTDTRAIFKILDEMRKKSGCPMGGEEHQKVIARVESLERQRAADIAQRKTLYLVIIGAMTMGGVLWGVITWAVDHLGH